MDQIIGHHHVLDILKRMQASGRMGNGLLLVGPAGLGKRLIAEQLIGGISGNPDVMIVERELNDKDEMKKNISIDQVRDLIVRLSMSTFSGGQNVGIIDGAHLLSIEAANALLKTIEDPAGNSLLILLATSTATIPATILSRCQVIHVPLVASEVICDELVRRGASRDEAHEISAFAAGRPGVALRLLEDKETYRSYTTYRTYIDDLLKATLPERMGLLGELGKEPKETLDEMLNVWELELHRRGDYQPLMNLIRSRRAIHQNVNPTLALEHAFL